MKGLFLYQDLSENSKKNVKNVFIGKRHKSNSTFAGSYKWTFKLKFQDDSIRSYNVKENVSDPTTNNKKIVSIEKFGINPRTCTCPNGEISYAADNNSDCTSYEFTCNNGTIGKEKTGNETGNGMQTTCAAFPSQFALLSKSLNVESPFYELNALNDRESKIADEVITINLIEEPEKAVYNKSDKTDPNYGLVLNKIEINLTKFSVRLTGRNLAKIHEDDIDCDCFNDRSITIERTGQFYSHFVGYMINTKGENPKIISKGLWTKIELNLLDLNLENHSTIDYVSLNTYDQINSVKNLQNLTRFKLKPLQDIQRVWYKNHS